jgi:hypothetical protein
VVNYHSFTESFPDILIVCRNYYRLERVVKHHSFTEFQILPDHVLIHEDGIQHLVDYEEKHGRRKEDESEEEGRNGEEEEEKVEFS